MTRREFPAKVRAEAFLRCAKRCELCTSLLRPGHFTYDHIKPDWMGGEPTLANIQVICEACDKAKTYGQDIPAIAKTKRVMKREAGVKRTSSRPLPGGRRSPWKKTMSGKVVPR